MSEVGNLKRRLHRVVALIAFSSGLVGLMGCATNRVDPMQKDLNSLRKTMAAQALQSADDQRRLEQTERQIAEIRGRLERQESDLAAVSRRDQILAKLSARVDRIDRELKTTAPGTQRPALLSSSPSPAVAPAVGVERLYRLAYDHFSSEEYDEALKSFAALVQQYPRSNLADNALYWSGEIYYVRKDYSGAVSFFQQVLDRYPKGNKAPDALLKLALCRYRMKDTAAAVRALNQVVQKYPQRAVSRTAKEYLERIQEEGK